MGYIVVTRNPRTKTLIVITDFDGEEVAEFDHKDRATEAADGTTVCKAWGYQIVEIDIHG